MTIITYDTWNQNVAPYVEVRDSRTGYLLPVRDAQGTLPDVESCWDAAVAAVAVAAAPAGPQSISSDTQSISSDTTKYNFRHNKV